jgi:hypothetical protein
MDHIEAGQLLRKWNGQPKEATMQETQATPVLDINALFSAAVLNAVNAATAPLVERIALLERSLVVADKAAQGSEATLFSRVEDLETIVRDRLFGEQPDKYKTSDLDEMSSRIAALEARLETITTASDERIQEIADDAARMVLAEHNEEYDHDGYDRLEDKINDKVEEAIDDYDFEDKVRDILRGASVNIDI